MKIIKIMALIMGGVACNQNQSEESFTKKDDPCVACANCVNMVNLKNWDNEVFDTDSIKIDGELPVATNFEKIINKFGKPDKVSKSDDRFSICPFIAINDSSEQVYHLFYDGIVFCRMGDSVVVNTIDFRTTNLSLVHPKIVLTREVNIRDVMKVYPESCKLIKMSGNAWSGHIELKTSNKPLDPRRWFLVFQGEVLIKIVLIAFSRE